MNGYNPMQFVPDYSWITQLGKTLGDTVTKYSGFQEAQKQLQDNKIEKDQLYKEMIQRLGGNDVPTLKPLGDELPIDFMKRVTPEFVKMYQANTASANENKSQQGITEAVGRAEGGYTRPGETIGNVKTPMGQAGIFGVGGERIPEAKTQEQFSQNLAREISPETKFDELKGNAAYNLKMQGLPQQPKPIDPVDRATLEYKKAQTEALKNKPAEKINDQFRVESKQVEDRVKLISGRKNLYEKQIMDIKERQRELPEKVAEKTRILAGLKENLPFAMDTEAAQKAIDATEKELQSLKNDIDKAQEEYYKKMEEYQRFKEEAAKKIDAASKFWKREHSFKDVYKIPEIGRETQTTTTTTDMY